MGVKERTQKIFQGLFSNLSEQQSNLWGVIGKYKADYCHSYGKDPWTRPFIDVTNR